MTKRLISDEQADAAREQYWADIRRIVDQAPPATPAQRDVLAQVLRGTTSIDRIGRFNTPGVEQ